MSKPRWRVFEINEVDTIAAKTRQQAIDFYKDFYRMGEDETLECHERSLKDKMYCQTDAIFIRKGKIYNFYSDKCYKITLRKAIKRLAAREGHKLFLLCSTEW